MNFYLVEKPDEKKSPEIITAVKQFLKERLSGAIEDPLLKLAYDSSNPFFLKTAGGIIWVRLFEEVLTAHHLPNLQKEIEQAAQMFHQKIRFYLFAPGYDSGIKLTPTFPLEMLFFEYLFIRSRFGQGIALRQETKIEFSEVSNAIQEKVPFHEAQPAPRLQNVRLDREELSELIDLSLELKGWSALPSAGL